MSAATSAPKPYKKDTEPNIYQYEDITNLDQEKAFTNTKIKRSYGCARTMETKFIRYLNQVTSTQSFEKQAESASNYPVNKEKQNLKKRTTFDEPVENQSEGNEICIRILREKQSLSSQWDDSSDKVVGYKKLVKNHTIGQMETCASNRPFENFSVICGTRSRKTGRIHGQAKLEFLNGNARFCGKVKEGQLQQGILTFSDGIQYEGEFKNQQFDGKGTLKMKNGTIYRSIFIQGNMGSRGQIIYPNGHRYKGNILNYKKHGHGELILEKGNRYVGNFNEGEITGYGVYYIKGNIVAAGLWSNGQFTGMKKMPSIKRQDDTEDSSSQTQDFIIES